MTASKDDPQPSVGTTGPGPMPTSATPTTSSGATAIPGGVPSMPESLRDEIERVTSLAARSLDRNTTALAIAVNDSRVQAALMARLRRGEKLKGTQQIDDGRVLFVFEPGPEHVVLLPRELAVDVDFDARSVARIIDPCLFSEADASRVPPSRKPDAPTDRLAGSKASVLRKEEAPTDVATYVARHLGIRAGASPVYAADRTAARLIEMPRGREGMEALAASVFWHGFKLSSAYSHHLSRLGVSPSSIPILETYVVAQHIGTEESRFDLLILDPTMSENESPRVADVAMSRDEQAIGWRRWDALRRGLHGEPRRRRRRSTLKQVAAQVAGEEPAPSVVETIDEDLIMGPWKEGQFGIVCTASPALELSRAPIPPWTVSTPAGQEVGTAGVFATNTAGQRGVTAAYHVLGERVSSGMPVLVQGARGTVVTADVVSDSVFVDLPGVEPPAEALDMSGPLRGVSPRVNESLVFVGVTSGRRDTRVTGWVPEIPLLIPGCQLRLLTTADTAAGDSGAAAVDGEGRVVGFSFARTGVGARIAFSTWIWAECVYEAHKLIEG